MKYLSLSLLLVLLTCFEGTGQVGRVDMSRYNRPQRPEQPSMQNIVRHKTNRFTSFSVNDSSYCLYNEDMSFVYVGSVKKKNDSTCSPDGYGLSCQIIKNRDNSFQLEYCLCPWKRGSRHGQGLIKTTDGDYKKVSWKWDKLKTLSNQEPSQEEINQIEARIQALSSLMKLLSIDRPHE